MKRHPAANMVPLCAAKQVLEVKDEAEAAKQRDLETGHADPSTSKAHQRHWITYLIVAFATTICFSLQGCVTTPQSTQPRTTVTFDYTPPEIAASGSADVTFAVVGATFESPEGTFWIRQGGAGGGRHRAPELFTRFANNMANDFNEMIIARGYTVRGPFRTHDQMTYPEKSGSDLVLTASVEFTPNYTGLNFQETATLTDVLGALSGTTRQSSGPVRIEGPITISNRVTLVVSESITAERMWTRSISLDPIRVQLSTQNSYQRNSVTLDQLLVDEGKFYSDLGRVLESQYRQVMQAAWNYLDPAEMKVIKRQSQEVRERKVFN